MDLDNTDRIAQVNLWLADVESGDKFINCNFTQFTPGTKLFEGLTGLEFVDCNLINCDLPADTLTSRCNTARIEYELVEEQIIE